MTDSFSYPDVENLEANKELPQVLTLLNGEQVTAVDTWENNRRPEMHKLLSHYMYGYMPAAPSNQQFSIDAVNAEALSGAAIQKQITITYGPEGTPPIHLLLLVPKDSPGRVPVFLGLNFYGNHSVLHDPEIPLSKVWLPERAVGVTDNKASEAARGTHVSRWSIADVIARGYGVATFYHGDVDPDKDDFTDGVHASYNASRQSEPAHSWGAIAAWAYGLHRAVDYLVKDPDVDASKIAVMGHSRNGKASLLAGATDDRIALVISNQSGCGGAALSRRKKGETVKDINERFPHWFNKTFHAFNENEDRLPFDQHMLIALIAPRPVLIASAQEDSWADPKGEFLALKAAEPAYKLFGVAGLIEKEMPAVNQLVGEEMGYHIRPGKHGIGPEDWAMFMDYADKFFR